MDEIKETLDQIKRDAYQELQTASEPDEIEEIRVRYLGRKGRVSLFLRSVKDIPAEFKPEAGCLGNLVKKDLEEALAAKESESTQSRTSEGLDVTLAGRPVFRGRRHVLTKTLDEILNVFRGMGYSVAVGPEVESDYYNFEALNFPADHPARDMQDTFFVTEDVVLRTHTSPMQIRTMEKQPPPVQIVCPGKVYRHDSDPSHSPMFNQVEGLLVDKGITLGDLKGTLTVFSQRMFGSDTKIRFRPSFFPFTEPSAEVDIQCVLCKGDGCSLCSRTGWIEILGSGMVDPNVYGFVDYDPETISGFAFGMGVERISMLVHGIDDIRLFFDNDLRFLSQF